MLGKAIKWFKQAIIYHIVIDRFAGFGSGDWNQSGFLGGNLKGITQKLGYLKELGINTLWLSPFYETRAYHGYHVTDFMKVEPNFGRREDLEELIKGARDRGIRIIADFVPNHCSKHHPFFLEAQKNKNSHFFNWFTFLQWPNDYVCFLDVEALPKLNLDNSETRDHIVDAAKYWLSMGIDGFRLDHVMGPKHSFWKYFRKEIKTNFPQAVLIGEAWLEGIRFKHLKTIELNNKYLRWLFRLSQDSVQKEYFGELDGVLDFRFRELVAMYIAHSPALGQTRVLESALERHFSAYPGNYFLATFLDNHDMNRFLFECHNDIEKLKAAAAIQFRFDQPVIIYYGTETGMTHQNPVAVNRPDSDLEARQPMNWESPNLEIFNFYKELIKTRVRQQRVLSPHDIDGQ
ncbi:MAG: alpha-amylase family glycosyl hydrolase [Desulfobacterales bacterium]